MKLFVIFLLFMLSSCRMIILNAMLKDPKVETHKSIREFLNKHSFSVEHIYVMKGDTSSAFDNLMSGMIQDYYIFEKSGRLLLCKLPLK